MMTLNGKYVPQLSAPWYTVHRELIKLFKNDPEVKVSELTKDTKEKFYGK